MHIISDTHFNHANIIIYEKRPFLNVEDMTEKMIQLWNSTVSAKDEVWHLGDFCFGNKHITKCIVSRLNGRIHLILGNHDGTHSYRWWNDCGFEFVSRHPILYDKYILSHRPIKDIPDGYFNIHGHTHSLETTNHKSFNVSAEAINYRPINLDKIKSILY